MLTRTTDATAINRILNDPSVFPWVSGGKPGPLDASEIAANEAHVVLMGEHGGVVFLQIASGYYEAHTAVLPEGRGAATLALGWEALNWMFCRTNAVEIVTRVAHGNLAALAAMRTMRMPEWFGTLPIWPTTEGKVPMRVYKLHILDWVMRDAERLAQTGRLFHQKFSEVAPLDHGDDLIHDAYVGAAIGMIRGGQAEKGVALYNLWAVLAGYGKIAVVRRDPLTIDIGSALLQAAGDSFRVMPAAA